MKRATLSFTLLALVVLTGCAGAEQQLIDPKIPGMLEACKAENETLRQSLAESQASHAQLEEMLEGRLALDAKLREMLKDQISAGTLTLSSRRGLLVVTMRGGVLFERGKAKVNAEGKTTVEKVAAALKGIKDRRVLVAGHTDNTPIRNKNDTLGSNWELSYKRGQAVADIMIGAGLKSGDVGVTAFGEFDPVAANDTDENKALNRRIEIIIVPNLQGVVKDIAKK